MECAVEAKVGSYVELYTGALSSGKDEGRPLGIGFQEQVPNRLKRLLLSAAVVSIEEKIVCLQIKDAPATDTMPDEETPPL